MTKDISIDVTISNVSKRTSGPYQSDYECDFTFSSSAVEVASDGNIDLTKVTEGAKLTFNLKTSSFEMNNQTYECSFPTPVSDSFWIALDTAPPPGKGNAPPFAGNGKLDNQFAVGNDSDSKAAILQDDNDDGKTYKYCLVISFNLGANGKDIVIDPKIKNRTLDEAE